MERATFNYIAKVLRDYPHLDQYISKREQEMMAPWREIDENIGGGKATLVNGQERMAIAIADDRQLNNLKDRQKVVAECLDETDETTHAIIAELYFKPRPEYTIAGLAMELHFKSEASVRNRRNHFFDLVAEKIGL